jgi:hypothetical protein
MLTDQEKIHLLKMSLAALDRLDSCGIAVNNIRGHLTVLIEDEEARIARRFSVSPLDPLGRP